VFCNEERPEQRKVERKICGNGGCVHCQRRGQREADWVNTFADEKHNAIVYKKGDYGRPRGSRRPIRWVLTTPGHRFPHARSNAV